MGGISVPDHADPIQISLSDIKVVSIAWGWLLGFSFLTAVKAGTQTLQIWRRVGHLTAYVVMIWLEIGVCTALGLICWLFMHGTFHESFAFYFLGTTLRCLIVQFIAQIVVNRIAILITSPRRRTILKWGPCLIILALNIGVYCVWIPAHLQISQTYVEVNRYYSRAEKIIYTLVDASLNVYFCYLVKNRLVNAGMAKYSVLYRFNLCLIAVNMSMDVLLIGLMSLPNQLIYVQFFPLTYMVKLNIEMSMAKTIAKVARAPHEVDHRNPHPHRGDLGSRGTGPGDPGSADSAVVLSQASSEPRSREVVEDDHKRWYSGEDRRHGQVDRRGPSNDHLYHAWISGGMSSQAHFARHKTGQRPYSPPSDIESGCDATDIERDGRKSLHVIAKNTIVHVRAESMRESSGVNTADGR